MSRPTTTGTLARPLVDRTCLLAAPTRPLHRAVASELAALGATVVVGHHREAAPVRTVDVPERQVEAGSTAEVIGDFSDGSSVDAVRDEVTKAVGSVDLLVVSTGVDRWGVPGALGGAGNEPAESEQGAEPTTGSPIDGRTWRSTSAALGRVFATVDGFYGDLRSASDGRLVALAALGTPGVGPAVATAECALVGLVRSLAKELAATPATANCVVTPAEVAADDRSVLAGEIASIVGTLSAAGRDAHAAGSLVNGSVIDLTTCLDPG